MTNRIKAKCIKAYYDREDGKYIYPNEMIMMGKNRFERLNFEGLVVEFKEESLSVDKG